MSPESEWLADEVLVPCTTSSFNSTPDLGALVTVPTGFNVDLSTLLTEINLWPEAADLETHQKPLHKPLHQQINL